MEHAQCEQTVVHRLRAARPDTVVGPKPIALALALAAATARVVAATARVVAVTVAVAVAVAQEVAQGRSVCCAGIGRAAANASSSRRRCAVRGFVLRRLLGAG